MHHAWLLLEHGFQASSFRLVWKWSGLVICNYDACTPSLWQQRKKFWREANFFANLLLNRHCDFKCKKWLSRGDRGSLSISDGTILGGVLTLMAVDLYIVIFSAEPIADRQFYEHKRCQLPNKKVKYTPLKEGKAFVWL